MQPKQIILKKMRKQLGSYKKLPVLFPVLSALGYFTTAQRLQEQTVVR